MLNLTLSQVAAKLRSKEVSSVELTQLSMARIQETDEKLHAFLTLNFDEAMEQAKGVDARFAKGEILSPLAGIPISIKDLYCTKGLRTTASAKFLKDFVPPYDATVIAKLREKGSVFMGKVNLDAWAHGVSTENSDFGPTHNPWDLEKVPGGSSGGSAASVASRQVWWSPASDTAGSIRYPASFCGVVGYKPTYGLTSRSGVISMASSYDTMGPICRSVEDASIIASEISGRDFLDATSLHGDVPNFHANLNADMKGVRIGIPKEYFIEGLAPDVEKGVRDVIEWYRSHGAEIVDVSIPHSPYGIAIYYIVCPAEASSNLARYDGIRYGHASSEAENLFEMFAKSRDEGLGDEAKRRIMIGTYVLTAGYADAYYNQAQKVRTILCREFEDVFKTVDVLLAPITPTTAFKLGSKNSDPLAMYLEDVLAVQANLVGIPAISLPCGFDSSGMPLSFQLMGPQMGEQKIFNAGYAYEKEMKWGEKEPKILEK